MSAVLAALLPELLKIIGALVGAAATYFLTKLGTKTSADATASKYQLAMQRVVALVMTFGKQVWPKLSTEFQLAMADGTISAEERAHLEDLVRQELLAVVKQDELEALGKDLGLPFAGVIAMIAARLLETVIAAHDPNIPSVSKALFQIMPRPDTGDAHNDAPAGTPARARVIAGGDDTEMERLRAGQG